jgi:hypothetical protein
MLSSVKVQRTQIHHLFFVPVLRLQMASLMVQHQRLWTYLLPPVPFPARPHSESSGGSVTSVDSDLNESLTYILLIILIFLQTIL